jgi:hypothetical protein
MYPLYAECPHCGFPAVVSGVETTLARHCRQCRCRYTPGVPLHNQGAVAAHRAAAMQRRRTGLRALIRRTRRVA